MRLDLVLGEPTPKRMLLRFAFVMGVLLLVAQVGVLLRLNIENATILILLACVPAIALVSTEELLEASVNRERRRQSEQAAQAAAQTAMETRHTELMNAIENLTELIPKQGEAFVPTELEQGELPGDFPEVEPEAVLEQMRKARLGARYALIRANLLQRTRARMDARIWK